MFDLDFWSLLTFLLLILLIGFFIFCELFDEFTIQFNNCNKEFDI